MRIEAEIKLDYDDVLLRPKRSTMASRKDVLLERTFSFYHSPKTWTGMPVMTANMATCGTFEMAETLAPYKMITTLHKYYTLPEYKAFFTNKEKKEKGEKIDPDYLCYTMGIRPDDVVKLKAMQKAGLLKHFTFVCIDVPNGYITRLLDVVRLVRKMLPEHVLIAGNVVTNEMTEEIILAGADIVKVGIGPGSACTTRRMTGVGYPQLSAVMECADAAHGIANAQGHGLVIADGGLRYPSCVAKAWCGGGDFVMSGTLFSGYEQSGGETVEKDGKKYKEYFGSSSNKALEVFYGKKDAHRASEGRHVLLPHKGDLHVFLQDLFGALRSTGTYIGARRIKEFSKRATFIRVSRQLNAVHERFDTGL